MIFLVLFLVFLCSLVYLKRRFYNPFSLCFVFGKKGSGKSCYLVHEILKHIKKGWTVYSDMPVNIEGVRLIDADDLSNFRPTPNSLVVLDEVGLTWNNRNYKSFSDGLTEYIKLQRHFKVKMIINSQSFDVDKKVRDCTDSMILQTNLFNCISISRPIIRTITLTEPTAEAESRIADSLRFDKIWHWRFYWMPRYFKYFDSFALPDRAEIPYTEMHGISANKREASALLTRIKKRTRG